MTRRAKPDRILEISRSFKAIAPDWETVTASFERAQVLTTGKTRWSINYSIHALYNRRSGRTRKAMVESGIALWPLTRDRRARYGWRERPIDTRLRRSCDQELALNLDGYEGRLFEKEVQALPPSEREDVMKFTISWKEEGGSGGHRATPAPPALRCHSRYPGGPDRGIACRTA